MKSNSIDALDLRNPGAEFSTIPFWVWNDRMTPELLERTLDALVAQHVRGVIIHPRPGLVTPYLSDEWFALWQTTLDLAARRGLRLWIYDENSYPSGFGGGHVAEAMPVSQAMGITLVTASRVEWSDTVLAAYLRTGEGYLRLARGQAVEPGADLLIALIEKAGCSAWYAGRFHTDLLRPGVTETFLRVTLEPYRQRFGQAFGSLIQGVFTDEPHLKPCGDIHWTPDLAERYTERWGEEFLDVLPFLKEHSERGRTFRHHLLQLYNELFIERWARPYHDYCEQNRLELTGHYWEHGWPRSLTVPDNMAMSAWQQRPGIDILFNPYSEGPQAQFGNVRSVLEIASVANQTGRRRTLCEIFGGSGAEMTFEDYKRIADWAMVLGVNTLNEHLSATSLRGARKRDYPPTFSYHSPWFECYGVLVDYFTRVTAALCQGEQVNTCLLLEPTTSAWMYHFGEEERLQEMGESFQRLVVSLAQQQIEFDLGCESLIRERGRVVASPSGGASFTVGQRAYGVVVIPAEMENVNRLTADLLGSFLAQGGTVLSLAGSAWPALVDGKPSLACDALRRHPGWHQVAWEEVAPRLQECSRATTRVVLTPDQKGIVYHQRRQLDDGEILFVVNTSDQEPARGTITTRAGGIRQVDLATGAAETVAASPGVGGGCELSFSLPPCGSCLYFLDATERKGQAAPPPATGGTLLPLSDGRVQRLDDNHLVLDYADIEVGGERRGPLYFKKADEFIFQKHGQARNPWDHAIQFKDEVLKIPFRPDSGFTATFKFQIEGAVPARLQAVVERADLYRIACNGVPVSAKPGVFWLDQAFGVLDLAPVACLGVNILVLQAAPMTVFHEFEAAHLIGDFSVEAADRGFMIRPSRPLALGPWNAQGLPLYGHRVAYSAQLSLPGSQRVGTLRVRLPAWSGIVAGVRVNGQAAGTIYKHPYECDISALVKPGSNTVEVVVYGALRNPLGPHLGVGKLAITDPWSWGRGPQEQQPSGRDYYTVPHGLSAWFEVLAT